MALSNAKKQSNGRKKREHDNEKELRNVFVPLDQHDLYKAKVLAYIKRLVVRGIDS